MDWTGKMRTTAKVGAPVELRGYAVPRRITLTVEGQGGSSSSASPDARLEFEVRDGMPQCVELHIKARPDGQPIGTTDLRMFDIDGLTESVFLRHAQKVLEPGKAYRYADADRPGAQRIIGARVRSDAVLRKAALAYLGNETHAGLRAVAAALNVSRTTAARRVKDARDAGLIPAVSADKETKRRYLEDLEAEGQSDAPTGTMTLEEAREWREARRTGSNRRKPRRKAPQGGE